MNYLIAGTGNQSESAFGFLLDELEGGITFVHYRNTGYNPKYVAQDIIRDAKANDYQVRLWTISVGDQVARYVEASEQIENLAAVGINPCSSSEIAKPSLRHGLQLILPPVGTLVTLTGWLGTVEFIPLPGNLYSLDLLFDQACNVAYGKPPHVVDHTQAIVISEQDQCLSETEIENYFPETFTVYIDTTHGDTAGAASEYLKAVQIIIESSASP